MPYCHLVLDVKTIASALDIVLEVLFFSSLCNSDLFFNFYFIVLLRWVWVWMKIKHLIVQYLLQERCQVFHSRFSSRDCIKDIPYPPSDNSHDYVQNRGISVTLFFGEKISLKVSYILACQRFSGKHYNWNSISAAPYIFESVSNRVCFLL